MTAAERQARQRKRQKERTALALEALAFVAVIDPEQAASMPEQKRRQLAAIQQRIR